MKKMSLVAKVLISFNVIIFLLLFVSGYLSIYKAKVDGEIELTKKVSNSIDLISSFASPYLYNVDTDPLSVFAKKSLQDSDVLKLMFFDMDKKILNEFTGEIKPGDKRKVIVESRDIIYEEEKLGYVELYYTDARIGKMIRSTVFMIGGAVLLIQLLISLALFAIMSRSIRPVKLSAGILGSTSDEMNEIASSLTEFSQILSESISEQAASIEETSSSLEELTGMVESNLSNATETNDVAKLLNQSSIKGKEMSVLLGTSMNDIAASNENVKKLRTYFSEISNKTKLIDEIVFQTKLLSFNASVEAERAGEHGRGFAVVAQEVGALAELSGKAALDISTIVKESFSEAESVINENESRVQNGVKLVDDAQVVFTEINENSTRVSEFSESIQAASAEQSIGIKEINTALSKIDRSIQKTTGLADDGNTYSRKVQTQSEDLNSAICDISLAINGSTKLNQQCKLSS